MTSGVCSPCLRGHCGLCTTPDTCQHEHVTAVTFKLAHCNGGWNVWGYKGGDLMFECLHLHGSRDSAGLCKTRCEGVPGYFVAAMQAYRDYTDTPGDERQVPVPIPQEAAQNG